MTESNKPDKSNRIVLVIMGILAVITIGGAIFATTTEWNTGTTQPAEEQQDNDTQADEEVLPSAGY